MSRSCPRVISPVPGRSTLITSAPNQARSWVQVGPAWTWLISSTRTPSSALPAAPRGRAEGFFASDDVPPAFTLAVGLVDFSEMTRLRALLRSGAFLASALATDVLPVPLAGLVRL